MKNLCPMLLAVSALLAGCGPRGDTPPGPTPEVTPPPSGETLNSESTVTESTSDQPTGGADVEDAETGTNTGRPDGPKDLQPGTDGNTAVPAR
jgi:hypothetical protein